MKNIATLLLAGVLLLVGCEKEPTAPKSPGTSSTSSQRETSGIKQAGHYFCPPNAHEPMKAINFETGEVREFPYSMADLNGLPWGRESDLLLEKKEYDKEKATKEGFDIFVHGHGYETHFLNSGAERKTKRAIVKILEGDKERHVVEIYSGYSHLFIDENALWTRRDTVIRETSEGNVYGVQTQEEKNGTTIIYKKLDGLPANVK